MVYKKILAKAEERTESLFLRFEDCEIKVQAKAHKRIIANGLQVNIFWNILEIQNRQVKHAV